MINCYIQEIEQEDFKFDILKSWNEEEGNN